jgi:hypothetical protein
MSENTEARGLSVTERDSILNHEVSRYAGKGYAVESASNGQAVLSKRSRIGWFWNIVLSVLTGGLWLIVVLYKVLNRKSERVVLFVDAAGAVRRR